MKASILREMRPEMKMRSGLTELTVSISTLLTLLTSLQSAGSAEPRQIAGLNGRFDAVAQAKYLKVFDDGVFQNGKTLGIRRNRNGRELLVGADRGRVSSAASAWSEKPEKPTNEAVLATTRSWRREICMVFSKILLRKGRVLFRCPGTAGSSRCSRRRRGTRRRQR